MRAQDQMCSYIVLRCLFEDRFFAEKCFASLIVRVTLVSNSCVYEALELCDLFYRISNVIFVCRDLRITSVFYFSILAFQFLFQSFLCQKYLSHAADFLVVHKRRSVPPCSSWQYCWTVRHPCAVSNHTILSVTFLCITKCQFFLDLV